MADVSERFDERIGGRSLSLAAPIAVLCAALALRLALVALTYGKQTHDLRVFVSWAHLLTQYGGPGLYTHVDAVDHYPVNYPPGYALILSAVVATYHAIVPAALANDALLATFLKVPAIAADLLLCVLAFAIVRRWYDDRTALRAATIAALVPSTWAVSAVWGQVDSICGALVALALLLTLRRAYVPAWCALTLAILVKPLPAVVVPLLLAQQLADRGGGPRAVLGPLLGALLAFLAALPFAPSAQPIAVVRWLFAQYSAGQALSSSTSENAYNVWTLLAAPTSDGLVRFGLTLQVWGWLGVASGVAAISIVLFRGARSFLGTRMGEGLVARGWFLALVTLFVFATRMHERYILMALALVPVVWYCGRPERFAAFALTSTFVACAVFVQVAYGHGFSPALGWVPHLLSAVNVLCFFALALAFFGRLVPLRAVREEAVNVQKPLPATE
jgi:Gpi18-like mannosyltransferase